MHVWSLLLPFFIPGEHTVWLTDFYPGGEWGLNQWSKGHLWSLTECWTNAFGHWAKHCGLSSWQCFYLVHTVQSMAVVFVCLTFSSTTSTFWRRYQQEPRHPTFWSVKSTVSKILWSSSFVFRRRACLASWLKYRYRRDSSSFFSVPRVTCRNITRLADRWRL